LHANSPSSFCGLIGELGDCQRLQWVCLGMCTHIARRIACTAVFGWSLSACTSAQTTAHHGSHSIAFDAGLVNAHPEQQQQHDRTENAPARPTRANAALGRHVVNGRMIDDCSRAPSSHWGSATHTTPWAFLLVASAAAAACAAGAAVVQVLQVLQVLLLSVAAAGQFWQDILANSLSIQLLQVWV
jgi:hypothetical protein